MWGATAGTRYNACMLRIGFVIDDLGHGGAQRQLALIAEALRGRAILRVVVLSGVREPYGTRLLNAGAEVIHLPRRAGFELARLRALSAALRVFSPDVIHGFLDASNAYAFIAARRLRAPVVMSLRSDRLTVTGPRAAIVRIMFRRADAVVVNSHAGREYLLRSVGVAPSRVHGLPNIIPPALPGAPRDLHMIGCVGRLVPLKRFAKVIDALPIVRAQIPDARLTIVGEGPDMHALRERAAPLGDAVTFTGEVENAAGLVGGFGCVVVASEYEGLPNAALEAMAAGVPVVAVRAGDLPGLIEDGVTGCFSAGAAPDALAGAIVRALADARLHDSARIQGPRLVAERFSAERARDALLAVYTHITNESGAPTGV